MNGSSRLCIKYLLPETAPTFYIQPKSQQDSLSCPYSTNPKFCNILPKPASEFTDNYSKLFCLFHWCAEADL